MHFTILTFILILTYSCLAQVMVEIDSDEYNAEFEYEIIEKTTKSVTNKSLVVRDPKTGKLINIIGTPEEALKSLISICKKQLNLKGVHGIWDDYCLFKCVIGEQLKIFDDKKKVFAVDEAMKLFSNKLKVLGPENEHHVRDMFEDCTKATMNIKGKCAQPILTFCCFQDKLNKLIVLSGNVESEENTSFHPIRVFKENKKAIQKLFNLTDAELESAETPNIKYKKYLGTLPFLDNIEGLEESED